MYYGAIIIISGACIGILFNTNPDFRGYVAPAWLRYIGDGSEVNMPYVNQDVILLGIWETRCSAKRFDAMVYDRKTNKVDRIWHDEEEAPTGCSCFLRSRYCDLSAPLDPDDMLKAME